MSRFLFGGVVGAPPSHVHVHQPPAPDPALFTDPATAPVVVDWQAEQDAAEFPIALAVVLEHAARATEQAVRDSALVVARHLGTTPADRRTLR